MSGYNGRRAVDPEVVMAQVVETKRVSPHMMRVTLGGEGIGRLTLQGYDQWFRLFMTRPGQENLRLPTTSSSWWYAQYLATPRSRRPHVRNYTVRASRADLREIDVDFVVHQDADGGTGPGAGFATACRTGERVGVLDQGIGYNPRHNHDWVLLIADESGLPAVAGICESLPAGARGLAIVEVPTAADKQDFQVPPGVELRWVTRDGRPGATTDGRDGRVGATVDEHDEHSVATADGRGGHPVATVDGRGGHPVATADGPAGHDVVPGVAALEAVRASELPDGDGYAFVVGESALATGTRRHLVNDRGMPKAHVDFVGYWKHGRPSGG